MTRRGLSFAISAVLVILWSESLASAQVATTCPSQSTVPALAYGERVTGCSLGQATGQDSYTFFGTSQDLVRASLWKDSGQGAPCVEIFDPSGNIVAGQACFTDLRVALSATGIHKIVVLAQRATGVFQYDLRLDRLFPVSPTSVALGIGDMYPDSLTYPAQYNLYHFAGFQNQVIWMDMTPRGGSGVPCITVYGPDRSMVFGPYCTNGGFTAPYTPPAYFTFSLPLTGTYVISINAQGDVSTVQYQLRLQRIIPVVPTARPIPYGGSVQAQVGPLGKMDMVYFDAAKDDLVSWSFGFESSDGPVGGSFYDAAGKLVGFSLEVGSGAGFGGYTIPASGRYTLLFSGPNSEKYSYSNYGTASTAAWATCLGQCPNSLPDSIGALSSNPASVVIEVYQGSNVASRSVQVSGPPSDSQLLLTQPTDSWVSVDSTAVPLPATLKVTVNANGLGPGTYTSRILLQSEAGALTQVPITLMVVPPPLTITTTSLPDASVTVSYGPVQLSVSGAMGPVLWTQTGLPLSAGLSLSTSGVLSGTPSSGSQGVYPLTVSATNAGVTVSTQLVLTIYSPATLGVLNFRLPATGGGTLSSMQVVSVVNDGKSTAAIQVSPGPASPWIQVGSAFNLAAGVRSQPISVQINRKALPPGQSYVTGTVAITGLSSPAQFEVNVALEDVPGLPLLSRTAMDFTIDANQSYSQFPDNLKQTVTVINDGPQAVNLQQVIPSDAFVVANWAPSPGGLPPNGGQQDVTITIANTNLNPQGGTGRQQVYQATLGFVFDDGSLNDLVVTVTVQNGSTAQQLLLYQTGLIFASAGSPAPVPQTVIAANYSLSDDTLAVTPLATWIHVLPPSQTLKGYGTASFSVSVDPSAPLDAAGVARGKISVSFLNGNVTAVSETVEVLFIGPKGSTAPTSAEGEWRASATVPSCVPQSLVGVFSRLSEGTSVPIGLPAQADAKIFDNCGNPVLIGAARVSFSNGDAPVNLLPTGAGVWQGTWQPHSGANATLLLEAVSGQLAGTATRSVLLAPDNTNAPRVPTGAVLNAASLVPNVDRVAPGAIISIFGTQLASRVATGSFPLPVNLASTQVQLGGTPLPLLWVGPGQINAVVPPNMRIGPVTALTVKANGLQSIPIPVIPLQTDPAIFPGAVTSASGAVISPSAPAHRSDTIIVYCTGLGTLNGSVDPTLPAPADPSLTVQAAVGAFVRRTNGTWASSHVSFAGLAPGFSGLYQVNVEIPTDAALGDGVPLYITAGANQSNQVLLSIR